MKSTYSSFSRAVVSVLSCLFVLASAGFAVQQPLRSPIGLAIDAKGNLYVANAGGNNILVYSPSFTQVTSKTITQNVSSLTAVAFDPLGNLWVANYSAASGSITEYTGGKQNVGATITNGIHGPDTLSIDSLGNIWVLNNCTNVTIYSPPFPYAPASNLVTTLPVPGCAFGMAVGEGTFSWGGQGGTNIAAATPVLINGNLDNANVFPDAAVTMANDAKGNVYISDSGGSVNVVSPLHQESNFVHLFFTSYGIAIDSKRGRVYFSNPNGNSISVYSTTGTLLKTIQ
jgi:DNA-binding beta-propeller fold protein YncE